MGKTVVGSRPSHRLTAKTIFHPKPQTAVVGSVLVPEPGTQAECQALAPKQVYLVTLPHTQQQRSKDGYPLNAPGSMTKTQVLDCLLWAC